MAQLVEQRIRNAWVAGSSPAIGSFLTLKELGITKNFPDSFTYYARAIRSKQRQQHRKADLR